MNDTFLNFSVFLPFICWRYFFKLIFLNSPIINHGDFNFGDISDCCLLAV